ncbi:hypothetical protein TPHA_0B01020 [Tetrapisispora phaffii CBS 4417]|uniref:Uncharacterized protein n=1 Tax=Tetrapisispora phaffii (strain ATCC 24235 / CBS 4417 / NBRC 1672 / NRRL Y-8282 / UCD 70-5) TaxID=1071381 RepID=G8BQH7_TETPH|nr:hypothetical protein TPHA_0B01020 [Tetrapisispora phaffii CBS 4417]CCE61774.1 hypothetical protein TPHA_0B01020 [Tetrapisispora phaffii CBS 4417]
MTMMIKDNGLVTRRLRHLRSIKIQNIDIMQHSINNQYRMSLLQQKYEYFLTIENLKDEIIYVSEVQHTWLNRLYFNEIPINEYPDYELTLKLMLKFPNTLLDESDSSFNEPTDNLNANAAETWIEIVNLDVNLNHLIELVNEKNVIESPNLFLFQFTNGTYIFPHQGLKMEPTSIFNDMEHNKSRTTNKSRLSANFNSLLKVNKSNDFISHIYDEINLISEKLHDRTYNKKSALIGNNNLIQKYINQLTVSIDRKQRHLEAIGLSFESLIKTEHNEEDKNYELKFHADSGQYFNEVEENDNSYGNKSYQLIKINNKLDLIRAKKCGQLVDIFKEYHLFDVENGGYIILNKPSNGPDQNNHVAPSDEFNLTSWKSRIELDDGKEKTHGIINQLQFKKVQVNDIMTLIEGINSNKADENEINTVNTLLGQYMLFTLMISKVIYHIPLPNDMEYCGSTCFINKTLPFFIPEKKKLTKTSIASLIKAIDLFNINIKQLQLHLQRY